MTIIGRKFGLLTAITATGERKNGSRTTPAWLCRCDCGRTRIVAQTELNRLRVVSCDTRRRMPRNAEYGVYSGMKDRCSNRKHKDYHLYGGRGVFVCDRWLTGEDCETGFECFIADMGIRPSSSHSIDRIDSNGNYEKGNCRWATGEQQARNRRNTRFVEVEGRRLSFKEAADLAGLHLQTFRDRIDRYGWPVERAMSTIVTKDRER